VTFPSLEECRKELEIVAVYLEGHTEFEVAMEMRLVIDLYEEKISALEKQVAYLKQRPAK
jgi:hypothetical protein